MSGGSGGVRGRSADIDERILDIAAGLFAVHGFDRTSLKQVADAAGYSKTGLLHRFPSKQALLEAVRALAIRKLDEFGGVAADTVADSHGAAVAAIIEGALDNPGLVQFLVDDMQRADAMNAGGQPTNESELKKRGMAIIGLFAGPNPTREQEFRTILALEMVCSGVVLGCSEDHGLPRADLTPLLFEAVARILDD
ncbi:TetR/AcrR family transcriptional regulator [Millisia brevis]|uniref:TetR/AcrR family transcriptional regulator n=1 Tax=Millisia brevis TaxID=264148 RepID=UPI0009FD45AD|nr:helix-turn-helix domain-containing protein [Millisia brevis]